MLQQAGASARVRLIAAAAKRWNVPEAECEAREQQGHAQARPAARSIMARSPADAAADQARQGAGDQDARSVQADRQVAAAARHAAQDQRLGQVRHRYRLARHGLCRHRRLPGVRRQAQKRRRNAGQGPPRRACRSSSSTTPSRSSPTASGAPRKRSRCSSRNGTRAQPATTDSAQFAKLYRDALDGPMVTRAQRRQCRRLPFAQGGKDRRGGLRSAASRPCARWSR